ncbi:MAG TPA: 16S rRNA (guanine(527)-N(7))-methyltransferase RsmG [Vicinamibacterales bacterium]|nr:16S rRNA (guanine(527)-N(7))-methyltransferase RsmG [Vicinamibacterales bacterium]
MTARQFAARLARRARRAGVAVDEGLAAALWRYLDLLFRWNQRINLTGLSPDRPDEVIDRLVIEPLVAARQLPRGAIVIDIGSGGGSPAVPLKLAAPDTRVTMVEAKARKCAFLREVVRQLQLEGMVVENARYEELLPRAELHEAFDVATVRAVRVERRLLLGLQAFVRPGGQVFLFRGAGETEIPAAVTPPLRWSGSQPLGDSGRLVILEKQPIGSPSAGPSA